MIVNVEFLFYLASGLILSWYFFKKINYDLFSIRGISLLYFFIFYPFVILLIAIQPLIFQGSEVIKILVVIDTLKAYNIFIFIFIVVEIFTKRIRNVDNDKIITDQFNGRIIFFSLFFIIALAVRFKLGLYYHVSINPEYNLLENAYQSVINRLHWLGLLPVFLMQYKYFSTKKKSYLFISLLFVTLSILIYIPSGSRTTAFLFFPIYIIYIMSQIKTLKSKLSIALIAFISLSIATIISGKIRVTDQDLSVNSFKDDISILIHRLSDSLVTGKIIQVVPSEYSYRYSDDMEVLLYTPFPSFLRKELGVKSDFTDGVQYIRDIGLSPFWTSVPVTLLGDFYSRFGWYGIMVFSILLSVILKFLDRIISKRDNLFKFVFLVLYSAYSSQIYVVDLQVLFVTITREFIIAFILAYVISVFINKKAAQIHK